MDDDAKSPGYILRSNYSNEPLFSTARRAAISLTYYGYCLENGTYTVKLDFAEIQFTDDELYKRVGKRFFDIYIQVIEIKLSKKFFFSFKKILLTWDLFSRGNERKKILILRRQLMDLTKLL